jgi:branched-chain amino acid transport system ATP-binding protein
MSALAVEQVIAGYSREVDILNGVSITLQQGEIVTILGPNGCGKSTLLKTVAGFLCPRLGHVTFGGVDVTRVPVHRKIREHAVGFVPQTDNVFGPLSVRENLLLGGQFLSPAHRAERFDEMLTRYPVLAKKRDAPAAALSGGERQILSLARALMTRPRILLLDEPSAGLSPKMLDDVFEAILGIRERENVAVLMVEQNAMEALGIADRAYVLAVGAVALTGRAADLLKSDEMRQLYLGGRVH